MVVKLEKISLRVESPLRKLVTRIWGKDKGTTLAELWKLGVEEDGICERVYSGWSWLRPNPLPLPCYFPADGDLLLLGC